MRCYFEHGPDYVRIAIWEHSTSRLLTAAGVITAVAGGSLFAVLDLVGGRSFYAGVGVTLLLALAFLHGGFVAFRDERRARAEADVLSDIGDQASQVVAQLDSAAMYIVRQRFAYLADAVLQPSEQLGPFSPPPDAPGNVGPLSNGEARQAFVRLQQLKVIEPTGRSDERGNIAYDFSALGKAVLTRLFVERA